MYRTEYRSEVYLQTRNNGYNTEIDQYFDQAIRLKYIEMS